MSPHYVPRTVSSLFALGDCGNSSNPFTLKPRRRAHLSGCSVGTGREGSGCASYPACLEGEGYKIEHVSLLFICGEMSL